LIYRREGQEVCTSIGAGRKLIPYIVIHKVSNLSFP